MNKENITNNYTPRRLEVKNVAGAGLQIHADVPFKADCIEFTLKEGMQMIASEPWIQFKADKRWPKMIEQTFKQMVELWNEKYGTK